MWKNAIDRRGPSARTYELLLKVARTIADLELAATVRPPYLAISDECRIGGGACRLPGSQFFSVLAYGHALRKIFARGEKYAKDAPALI
jgi:hypothetical protein